MHFQAIHSFHAQIGTEYHFALFYARVEKRRNGRRHRIHRAFAAKSIHRLLVKSAFANMHEHPLLGQGNHALQDFQLIAAGRTHARRTDRRMKHSASPQVRTTIRRPCARLHQTGQHGIAPRIKKAIKKKHVTHPQ